ncbi:dephospho-CoA kinase [Kibdelosporangium phytohabitans]|uniref:Dephospho-CoA kinase n=1 Tax=Kibdelosporangium phytohabitans TaxID=860235 RepID=A0A0N9HYJ4_9PSEU|nr:dephospho-CoA kinase [Kibdelosporangium phytohabitans]ALG12440.1 dephospho-CoA kinase [Kibdelosporangium phytohabitans]MBE1464028.1 dephospho-CoA kinase [Kibdelosporangium phytohabitans]
MLRVGLTGGIGSGKSTVAGRLAEHGAVLIDADKLAREVVQPGTPGLAAVVEAFGAEVLAPDGSLDRPKLAAVVFNSAEQRERLNGIVHPLVGRRTAEMLASAADDAVVVHDVPLLVEKNYAPMYHLVVVVDADVEERVRRLAETRGMSPQDARARIAAQATVEQRRAVADVWLDNSSTPDRVLAQADALWADRLVPFEANVRLRRWGRYGNPRLYDYNAEWPLQAARLAARIELVTGGLRVDHIGSTAVPGLPAKDIIDLQVTVSSLDQADGFAEPLTAAGFPVRPENTGDRGKETKRYHNCADPGRLANIHLRVEGSEDWRNALLFRDWLRASVEERASYVQLKQGIAKRFASAGDLAEVATAKDAWFDSALPRAQAWAEATGWQP